MAFRLLSATGKMVVLGLGAAAVGGFASFIVIPYYTDMYKVMYKVNEIPRFKRQLIVDDWKILQDQSDNVCLLKKYLDEKLLNNLKNYKTVFHGDLAIVMREALRYPKAEVGANAPDHAVYDLFQPLFDPIIADLHNGFGLAKTAPKTQPATDWGEKKLDYFENLATKHGDIVKEAKLECYRSLKHYTFQPTMTESDYFQFEAAAKRMNNEISAKYSSTDPDLTWKFYPFRSISDADKNELERSGVYFRKEDDRLKAVGAREFWPVGRGVYCNKDKTLVVQLNNEEHLKFISPVRNGDIKSALNRLIKGTQAVNAVIPFTRHDRLGSVGLSPRNLGSGVLASFDLKLPKISKKADFKDTCEKLNLSVQQKDSDTVTVSNKFKLGLTEFETVKLAYDGVKHLIELEKQA